MNPPLHTRPGASVLLLALVAGLGAGACGGDGSPDRAGPGGENEDGLPTVVASIFPVADLARALVGPRARVDVLLPPRASPATFEITPREVRIASRARLHLLIGGGLDAWAGELLEAVGRGRAVILTDGMELEAGRDRPGTGNPHVWLDPVLTRERLVPRLVEALVATLPTAEAEIRSRARALTDTLTRLDHEIRARLRGLEGRAFVATHPAWTYFGARYGLREVGVVHAHPGQEASARALAGLVDAARAAGVTAVFSEPQIGETGARALAQELSVPVVILDPLGGEDVPGRDSYPALLRFNVGQLVRGLGPGAPRG